MSSGKKQMVTYQSSGAVDAGIASPNAVQPLGLAELPQALLLHDRIMTRSTDFSR